MPKGSKGNYQTTSWNGFSIIEEFVVVEKFVTDTLYQTVIDTVEVEKVVTDTLYSTITDTLTVENTVIDTLYQTITVTDTVTIEKIVKDTVEIEKTVTDTLTVERVVTDTLYQTITVTDTLTVEKVINDTLYLTVTDTVEVEKIICDTIYLTGFDEIPLPVIEIESGTVTIKCPVSGVPVYYTLDGSVPGIESLLYTVPFEIENDCTVTAMAIIASGTVSEEITNSGISPQKVKMVSRSYYNESGLQTETPQKGVVIVLSRYDDGSSTIRKMVVK